MDKIKNFFSHCFRTVLRTDEEQETAKPTHFGTVLKSKTRTCIKAIMHSKITRLLVDACEFAVCLLVGIILMPIVAGAAITFFFIACIVGAGSDPRYF